MNSVQLCDSFLAKYIHPKVKQLHSSEAALQPAKLAHALNASQAHCSYAMCSEQALRTLFIRRVERETLKTLSPLHIHIRIRIQFQPHINDIQQPNSRRNKSKTQTK